MIDYPIKSPRVGLVQPRTFCAETLQKGDSNGESIEEDKADVDLKFTLRKHNLDTNTDT